MAGYRSPGPPGCNLARIGRLDICEGSCAMTDVNLYEAMSTLRAVRRLRPDPSSGLRLRRCGFFVELVHDLGLKIRLILTHAVSNRQIGARASCGKQSPSSTNSYPKLENCMNSAAKAMKSTNATSTRGTNTGTHSRSSLAVIPLVVALASLPISGCGPSGGDDSSAN